MPTGNINPLPLQATGLTAQLNVILPSNSVNAYALQEIAAGKGFYNVSGGITNLPSGVYSVNVNTSSGLIAGGLLNWTGTGEGLFATDVQTVAGGNAINQSGGTLNVSTGTNAVTLGSTDEANLVAAGGFANNVSAGTTVPAVNVLQVLGVGANASGGTFNAAAGVATLANQATIINDVLGLANGSTGTGVILNSTQPNRVQFTSNALDGVFVIGSTGSGPYGPFIIGGKRFPNTDGTVNIDAAQTENSFAGTNFNAAAPALFFNNSGGGLTGSFPFTINYQDSNGSPVSSVPFLVIGQGSGISNASGGAAYGLPAAGSYNVSSSSHNLLLFPPATLVIPQSVPLVITGTGMNIPTPSAPNTSIGVTTTTDGQGNTLSGIMLWFKLVSLPSGLNVSSSNVAFSATSNASGGAYAQFEMGCGYIGARGSNSSCINSTGPAGALPFTVPNYTPFELPEFIGNP